MISRSRSASPRRRLLPAVVASLLCANLALVADGGAAFSVVSAATSSLLDTMNAHWWVLAIIAAVFVAVALGTFWTVLQSAALARNLTPENLSASESADPA